MTIFFNKNALKNKIQHYKLSFIDFISRFRKNSEHSYQDEYDKVDEASRESFPASDPPGHISKSSEDNQRYSSH